MSSPVFFRQIPVTYRKFKTKTSRRILFGVEWRKKEKKIVLLLQKEKEIAEDEPWCQARENTDDED